jgi:hypothetical protein
VIESIVGKKEHHVNQKDEQNEDKDEISILFASKKTEKQKTSVVKSPFKLSSKKLLKDVQKTKDVTENLSAVNSF